MPEAQFNLGVMYDEGKGVPQDHIEAEAWFRKAAEQGNPDAQFTLGLLYHRGQSVSENHTEAADWFRKAAEQGDPKAPV